MTSSRMMWRFAKADPVLSPLHPLSYTATSDIIKTSWTFWGLFWNTREEFFWLLPGEGYWFLKIKVDMDYSNICEDAKQDLYLFFRYNVYKALEWGLLTAESIPYEYGWKAILQGTSWPGEQVFMWNLGSGERNVGKTKPSYSGRQ